MPATSAQAQAQMTLWDPGSGQLLCSRAVSGHSDLALSSLEPPARPLPPVWGSSGRKQVVRVLRVQAGLAVLPQPEIDSLRALP